MYSYVPCQVITHLILTMSTNKYFAFTLCSIYVDKKERDKIKGKFHSILTPDLSAMLTCGHWEFVEVLNVFVRKPWSKNTLLLCGYMVYWGNGIFYFWHHTKTLFPDHVTKKLGFDTSSFGARLIGSSKSTFMCGYNTPVLQRLKCHHYINALARY